MASFGFSVGDFITCLSLVRQVTQALGDSTGSVADYKSFLQTLNSLNQTFTTSELIYLQWQNDAAEPTYSSNAQAMVNGMLFERQQCKTLMEGFLKASESYNDAFLKRREKTVVRGWRKVTWLYRKEEISRLERDLQGHMRAMQIYADALFQNQMARHTEVVDSQFQRLFSSVVDMRTDISAMSKSMQTSSSQLPRSLGFPWEASSSLAENVLLFDANGRSLLLPMLFLSTPHQFHELLELIYRGMPGHRRILRKEYTITNEDSDGIMVQESNWDNVIRAGIQLSLNIILQASSSWKKHHCPRCDEPTLGHTLPGKRRRCHKCQLTYRLFEHERVVEGNTVVTSDSETVNTTSPKENASGIPDPELRHGTKRKGELFIREESYFKLVHYHREIQVIKKSSNPTSIVEVEPQQLKVEDLPPLHRAAANGSLAEISVLLENSEMVDSPLPFNAVLDKPVGGRQEFKDCSPLHLAAFFGRAKAIELLLDQGANICAKDWFSSQPLHYTLTGENYGVAMLLMARGADVNATNEDGDSFLHHVCEMGITWLLPPILEYGGDLTATDKDGGNALHVAAYHGQEELVETLLGKDIATCLGALDNRGGSPLHDAAWNGSARIAAALLEHGEISYLPEADGRTPLHLASERGNYEVAKLLLERGCTVDIPSKDGHTPLHSACWNIRAGAERILLLLLESGADTAAKDKRGSTPLHLASLAGNAATIERLLKHGADIGVQNAQGLTPLHNASWNGNLPALKLLLEAGAIKSLEIKDITRATPLHHACWNNMAEAANLLLLSYGADVTIQDEDGEAPLHFAALAGNSELTTMILGRGADANVQNNDGGTPLYYASRNNHTEVAKILLKYGARVNTHGKNGETPLHQAAFNGHEAVVKLLLENGAKAMATDNARDTPLHLASKNGHAEAAKHLIEYGGIGTNTRNSLGRTPFRNACIHGHESVVKLLIVAADDVNAFGTTGMSPLHYAAHDNHEAIVRLLLKHGADPTLTTSRKYTALHIASGKGYLGVVQILAESGADLNAQNGLGRTALHWTCLKHPDLGFKVIEYLLDHRSDPFIKDRSGRTPFDIAESKNMVEVAALLRKRMSDT